LHLVLAAAGCGRSTLVVGRGASEAAGGEGGGTTTGSGAAGAGGGASACAELSLHPPSVTVAADSGWSQRIPRLLATGQGDELVTVAYQQQPIEGPGPFTEQRHASFTPWLEWPETGLIATTWSIAPGPDLVADFAAGRSGEAQLALAVAYASSPTGLPVVVFAPTVSATGADAGPTVTIGSGRPLFVARSTPGHLVGARDEPAMVLRGTLVRPDLGITEVPLAGTSWAAPADAVAHADGWVVAASSAPSAPAPDCQTVLPSAAAATRIDLLRVTATDAGLDCELLTSTEAGAPLAELALAPHPDGAWVAWRVASGGVIPPIKWARLDVAQAGWAASGEIGLPGGAPVTFAVAALGRDLAVAWGDDPADESPELVLDVIDEHGSPHAHATVTPPYSPPLSLIGSPDGRSLVVGYDTSAQYSRLGLLRFDCAGP
jgi:hypothetical protein